MDGKVRAIAYLFRSKRLTSGPDAITMNKRSLWKSGALVAIFAMAGTSAWVLSQERRGDEPIAPAIVATAEIRIVALGELLPQSNILTIAAPSGQEVGRIATIEVKEGDFVKKDTVLAILDTLSSRRAQSAEQEAMVAQKRAALEKQKADLAAEGAKLKAQLAEQVAVRDKLAGQIERQAKLRQSGVVDAASLADLRLDLASAEANARSIEVSLERNGMRDGNNQLIDEASMKADLDAAIAALEKAKADEAKSYILAPISGRILTLHGKIGEQIRDDGFAEIGDTSIMTVRAEVYESDIAGISVGDKAVISSRSIDGEMNAIVDRIGARISKQSITSTDPAATVDARVVEVWLALDGAASRKTKNLSGLQVQAVFASKDSPNA
jgi:HlyD family secretion protein